MVIAGMCFAFAPSAAADRDDPTKPNTSAAARANSAGLIPLDKLDPASKAAVSEVVAKAGIFRRMPVAVVPCDPNLYTFMVRNPEVIANIWDVMGVSKVTMRRTADGCYQASDGVGTMTNVRFVYTAHDTHVIYADGSYTGPLFRRAVKAKCVLVLKSAPIRENDGQIYVTSRMDAFIHLEPAGVELLARTVQPLIGKAADYNFTETAAFLGSLSRTAERHKPDVYNLAGKLTKIDAPVREQFVKTVDAVPAAVRTAAAPRDPKKAPPAPAPSSGARR